MKYVLAGVICPANEKDNYTQVLEIGTMEECEKTAESMTDEDASKYTEIFVMELEQYANSSESVSTQ